MMSRKRFIATGTLAMALLAASACAQRPTGPDPAAPGSDEGILGQGTAADSAAVSPAEMPSYSPRKRGMGTE